MSSLHLYFLPEMKYDTLPASPKPLCQQCLIYFRGKNDLQSLILVFFGYRIFYQYSRLPAELAHINKLKCKWCAHLC